jgi:hypothetical protein
MRDRINAIVKMREAFRPFAPTVSLDQVQDWYALLKGLELPYMVMTPMFVLSTVPRCLRLRTSTARLTFGIPRVGAGRRQSDWSENGAEQRAST